MCRGVAPMRFFADFEILCRVSLSYHVTGRTTRTIKSYLERMSHQPNNQIDRARLKPFLITIFGTNHDTSCLHYISANLL